MKIILGATQCHCYWKLCYYYMSFFNQFLGMCIAEEVHERLSILSSRRIMERVYSVILSLTLQIHTLPFPHCFVPYSEHHALCQLGCLAFQLPVELDQWEALAGDPRVEDE